MVPMLTSRKTNSKSIKNSEYYDMLEITDKLYEQSMKGIPATQIMELVLSPNNIMLAYRNIKKNKGSHTPGVDGKTIKDLEKLSQEELIKGVQTRLSNYNPKAVKRVMIPKKNGKMRPLGIPAIWDRLIQQCILQILEPICEARFHQNSNGYRPYKSAENAIAQTMKMIQQQQLLYVVDVDIEGFFDNVNHHKLKLQLWNMGIQDKTLLKIIDKMLKADIQMPDGTREKPTKGTPQGGILSPLLANIVLNELDWWISSQWENFPTKKEYKCCVHENGTVNKSHKYEAIRKTNLKEMFIVRYADDFKIFCRNYEDAMRAYYATVDFLNKRLKLNISPEKSKVTNLKHQKSEFLGFSFRVVKKSGKYVVSSAISKKDKERIEKELYELIDRIKHGKDAEEICKLISLYNSKVIGIHNYYRMATKISVDVMSIQKRVHLKFHNALKEGYSRYGKIKNGYILKNYGKSRNLRYYCDKPIVPIQYVKTKNAMHVKKGINKYTKEGRKLVKEPTDVIIIENMCKMMNFHKAGQTVEYLDNRISRYVAQKGKCAITGKLLSIEEIHCHHKCPKKDKGDDSYENLIILHKDVHKLLHATKEETIQKYMQTLNLTPEQLQKLNKLRASINNAEIKM